MHTRRFITAAIAIVAFLIVNPVHAATTLDIKAITWDVIGLDSNKPSTDGPVDFPLAVRVTNTGGEAATNVVVTAVLGPGGNPNVNLVGVNPLTKASLAIGESADFYFNIKITRPPANNSPGFFSIIGNANTTKKYVVTATADNAPSASTPNNRQLFVEKILSQNRNSVAPTLTVDNPGLPFLAGQTRMFTLNSQTASSYDQVETTINFPNEYFQIQAVRAVYTEPMCGCLVQFEDKFVAPFKPLVIEAGKFTTNKVYVDACSWVTDFNSPDYMTSNKSCTNDVNKRESSTGKVGGTIVTQYVVKVVKDVTEAISLDYLIHDHSGSSFHYNFTEDIFRIVPTNVKVTKTAPATVEAMTNFDYTIVVENTSTNAPAHNVVLSDSIPPCVTFVSADPAPMDPSANPLLWELGTLDPGETHTFKVTVKAGCTEGDCENTAIVATTDMETNLNDNEDDATVDIQDTTDPVITCPADALNLDCSADTSVEALGKATATDNCPGVEVGYIDDTTDGCGNTVTIKRTWTATDAAGNVDTCVQNISTKDTTPPTIEDLADRTIECGASTAPNETPDASDTCGSVEVTHSDGSMSDLCGNTGVFTRTWTAKDACGNTATSTQIITVQDKTPPTIEDLADRTIECGSSTAPNETPDASDTCGSVEVTHSDGSMSDLCGNTGAFTRTWTAKDACGNTATSTQIITVQDKTPPTIEDLADRTIECGSSTAPNDTPDASDTCGSVEVTHSDGSMSDLCGNTGAFTRTWTAKDACGNTATSTQIITVIDKTAPTIGDVDDVTIECGESTDPSNTGGPPTATDTCGTATVGPPSDSEATPICGNSFSFVRTWTATDACGNTKTSEQTITVEDTTPPSVTCPADINLPAPVAPDTCSQADYPNISATDSCGGAVDITFDPPENEACFPCGSTTVVKVTAKDACGNSSTCTFNVIVADCADGCSLTQGYWKNHPNDWPVESLKLGNHTYTKAQCIRILKEPVKKNGLIMLAHQLIAAKLNVLSGADSSCIATFIDQADALIGAREIPPIGEGHLTTKQATTLNNKLDDFNNGRLCVPHCDDVEPDPVTFQIF